jgi:hypothetical protein
LTRRRLVEQIHACARACGYSYGALIIIQESRSNPFDTPAALFKTGHGCRLLGKIGFIPVSVLCTRTQQKSNLNLISYKPLLTQKEAFKLDHLHQFSSRSR